MLSYIKYVLLFLVVLVVQSCEIDNYEQPTSTIKGKIIDKETNKLVPCQGLNGSFVSLFEFYNNNWSPQPNKFFVHQNGEYISTAIYDGLYRIILDGPYAPIDTAVNDVKKMLEHDFLVLPYLRVSMEAKSTNGGIDISTTIQKTAAANKIQKIVFLVSKTPYVDKSTFDKSKTIELAGVLDDEIVGQTFQESITGLASGSTVYVRVGALAKNNSNYYNYSTIEEVKIP